MDSYQKKGFVSTNFKVIDPLKRKETAISNTYHVNLWHLLYFDFNK